MAGERTFWRYFKLSVLTIFSLSAFYYFIMRNDYVHISSLLPNSPKFKPQLNPPEFKPQLNPPEFKPQLNPPEFKPKPNPPEFKPKPNPSEFKPKPNPSEFKPKPNPSEFKPKPNPSEIKPTPNPSELKPQTNYSELKPQPTENPGLTLPLSTTRHPLTPPYPYPYKFLLNPKEKCQKQKPFLVLLVIGDSHDANSRLTIRETWGNESNYRDVAVVTVFLIGIPRVKTETSQKLLEEEMKTYGDIVQQDFMDTYYNLTLKTLMGMEWISKYCPGASYVMKIDNDMFLNVEYLVHHLLQPGLPVHQNYFTGYIVANTGPLRGKEYKWYVPKEVYPNDTYPPYCSGPGYAFSADMAKKIYDVAQTIRVVPMEDSFMGICLYELKIPPTNPPPNIFNGHRIDYDCCKFNKLITVHHYKGDELRKVWKDFWTQRSGCKD